ncbi:MAG: DUF1963 domain-containing protein [Verrucomicrobiales bacterium]|nr:DUF1963 domain-containing protein [Verrucomicrobiales bacterium]MCP5556820.1 DUF1963 domain-containing protein [Verrucomicrobiaceae bacterium]
MPVTHHELVNLEHWAKVFPLVTFEQKQGNRQFNTTKRGDPLDLWKARGSIITSPADLCEIELSRQRAAETHDLGERVHSHIFLWKTGEPEKPYLTKVGGTPFRPASRVWPKSSDGALMTFVVQFCFADSKEILPYPTPGDVMLVFMSDSEAFYGAENDIHIEWSDLTIDQPLGSDACPKAQWTVPSLTGVLHRTFEYPESWKIFNALGHYQPYLFDTTQSTKISTETHFIQGDPSKPGQKLLCVLSSIRPTERWPFVDLERLPKNRGENENHSGWGKYEMSFGDAGCIYFFIDRSGRISWSCDSY